MTDRPLRAAALFVLALLICSGGAYLLQQSLDPGSRALVDVASAPPPYPAAAPPPVVVPETASTRAPGQAAAIPDVSADWVSRTADQSGVPAVALRAYARAELSAAPSCHLGWTTLAGVGWVESQHGTLGGRTLGADGRSSSLILGPALDGTHHTRAIPATRASARLDGDPRWDHAVGPMQFIPSAWAQWGVDGDGDGVADPGDIDDAALAAAHLLCAAGGDLSTASGWSAAVLAYNHDQDYLDAVHAAAEAYAQRTVSS